MAIAGTLWRAPDRGSGGSRVLGGRIVKLADAVCALPNAAQVEVWEDEGGALAGPGQSADLYGRRRNGLSW